MKVSFMICLMMVSSFAFGNASVKCRDGKVFPLIIGDNDPTPEAEKKCKDNKGMETIMIQATPGASGMSAPPILKGP